MSMRVPIGLATSPPAVETATTSAPSSSSSHRRSVPSSCPLLNPQVAMSILHPRLHWEAHLQSTPTTELTLIETLIPLRFRQRFQLVSVSPGEQLGFVPSHALLWLLV
jgi:hypothetical protein